MIKLQLQIMELELLILSLFTLVVSLNTLTTINSATGQNVEVLVRVRLAVDMDSYTGQMGLVCIQMALSEFYAAHHHFETKLLLSHRDSKRDIVGVAAAGKFCDKSWRQSSRTRYHVFSHKPFSLINLKLILHSDHLKRLIPSISHRCNNPSLWMETSCDYLCG
ncbi:hypothetical protein ACS0TY_025197 [Phlomoides rotata]